MTTQPDQNPKQNSQPQPANELTNLNIHTMQDDLVNPISQPNLTSNPNKTPFEINQQTSKQQLAPTKSPFEENTTKTTTEPAKNSNASDKKTSNGNYLYNILIFLLALIIIIVLGFGFYYFQQNKQVTDQQALPSVATTTPETKIAPAINEKYSTEKTNLITINLPEATSLSIKNQLQTIATEIKALQNKQVYEFNFVDQENNPISFQLFAEKTGLTFSPTIMSELSNNFSFFFFNDNDAVYSAISLSIAENISRQTISTNLLQEEATLVDKLTFLFLDKPSNSNKKIFGTSSTPLADGIQARYLNLSDTANLSIDYITTEKNIIIGTSKETLKQTYLKTTKDNTISNNNPAPASLPTTTVLQ